jgi:2-amino-4-hydroxy-6-hydroxymethyldihydropteridine diphosphokinase
MAQILLSIGSNIEPRARFLRSAIKELDSRLNVVKVSSLYETEALGFDGDDFLNAAVLANTELTPLQVLELLHEVEQLGGRKRSEVEGYASRTIDLDLIFYDNYILISPELIVPHPKFAERNFVLKPLVELYPRWIDPLSQLTLVELLSLSKDAGRCELF